jgi:hypothetical protein
VRPLEEVAKLFGVSKAVFKGKFIQGDTSIDFSLRDKYWPDASQFKDPIAKLLAKAYDERFDTVQRKFVHHFSFEQIYKKIVDDIRKFYVDHSPLKNPKQSTLYKWLDLHDNNRYSHPASEGFIALYRYIHGNSGIGTVGGNAPINTTVENVLAILELMKEKYEVEQEAD